jgi:NTP pyrophosphatase (non-canonical NTP hydrolase)
MNGLHCVANLAFVSSGSLLLVDYASEIAQTDVLNPTDVGPILQGIYGEVGGIMSAAKKLVRERSAFIGYRKAAEEEFGDTLWYLTALCRRLRIPLDELFAEATDADHFMRLGSASDLVNGPFAHVIVPRTTCTLDEALFKLGRSAAALLGDLPTRAQIVCFTRDYLCALHAAQLVFADVARSNLRKARGAFLDPDPSDLIDFDKDFSADEQLPRNFKIRINERDSGKSYLQWNGVFIGDPLTDNISDRDDYRFHDVFHFAYAAILHWSPVVRSLIKQKRKSSPEHDEDQDSGRAIVVEEGLTAWIFSRAKELEFFSEQDRISLEILKTIGQFVAGYEVEKCPLKLWEKSILEGYRVFRQIKEAKGGWIVGDRKHRTIQFEPLSEIK